MLKYIEELRNAQAEISRLELQREELRKKLENHRTQVTPSELEDIKAEKNKLDAALVLATEKRDMMQAIADDMEKIEKRGEDQKMNGILSFKENMERTEIVATIEYRNAFFKRLQGKKLLEDEERAYRAVTSSAVSAGAAIPTHTMDLIIGQLRETPSALGLITLTYVPGLTSYPVESAVSEAAWVNEAADSTPSDDKLKSVSLAAYTLIKTIKISAQLTEMSVDAFEEWIVNSLIRKLRKALDKSIFAGTGSNQPKGLNASTWDKSNSVEVAASASVTYDNLVDLESLLGEDFAPNAVWVMNKKTKAQIMKIKDDQKRPIYERALEDGFTGRLLGYPVRLDANVADNEMYFGDWEAAYVMNIAKPIEILSSAEAGFMSGSTVYRGMALADGKPTDIPESMVKLKKGV